MFEANVHRITNFSSFEETTKGSRQIAGLYFYQMLDCLLDLTYQVSADFRRRPQLYRDLGSPSIATTMARLYAEYGTQIVLPSKRQRTEIYTPIFGTSENDGFAHAQNCLFSAVTAYAEHAGTRGIEMLRENVRTALLPFRNYLLTLHGDSVKSSREILLEMTEKICYPVLRNQAVAAVFGIAKHAALEYPYATEPAEDLLMEAISMQLKSGSGPSIGLTRERISSLQRAALLGTQAIATVIDFEEARTDGGQDDIDLLITTCYAWKTALASLKSSWGIVTSQSAQPGQPSSNSLPAVSSSSLSTGTAQARMLQTAPSSSGPRARRAGIPQR